jgi:hypothetical protein
LLAGAASIALMLLFNLGGESLLLSSIQNLGHFLIFTVLAYGNLALFRFWPVHPPMTHLTAVLALLCLGGFVEIVQSFIPGRTASWNDLWLDAAGIIMGYLLFALTSSLRNFSSPKVAGLMICILITGFLATQPALKLVGYHLLKTGSPAIISFGDPFVDATISVTGTTSVEIVEKQLPPDFQLIRFLRMDLADENYGGVIFHDTANLWTEAGFLDFQIHNLSDEKRQIALRIHDNQHNNDYHDRFNSLLLVQPGSNNFRLPISEIKTLQRDGQTTRHLDMDNIHEIQLFSIDSNSFSLYLSDLRLTPL